MARPVDLGAEWSAATAAVRERHLDPLRLRYGIPPTTIIDRLGVARVRVEVGTYEPDNDGVEMLLIASFAAPPRLPDGRWRAPNEIIDLIAFRLAEPGRWWLRCGIVAALGEEMIGDFADQPVRIWRTPLQWLQAGATGICLTTRDAIAAQDVLIRLRTSSVVMDVEHGREIDRIRGRCWTKFPPILVADPALAGIA